MISDSVIIMTKEEFEAVKRNSFQTGIVKGRHDRGVELNREIDKLQKLVTKLVKIVIFFSGISPYNHMDECHSCRNDISQPCKPDCEWQIHMSELQEIENANS